MGQSVSSTHHSAAHHTPATHQLAAQHAPPIHQLAAQHAPPIHQLAAQHAPPIHQPAAQRATSIHQLATHGAPPTHQPAAHGAPPTHQPAAHDAPPTHQPATHGAPPTHQSAAHGAPPTHQPAAHGAPPTHHPAAHGAPPTHQPAAHSAPPTHQPAAHGAPPTHQPAVHGTFPMNSPLSYQAWLMSKREVELERKRKINPAAAVSDNEEALPVKRTSQQKDHQNDLDVADEQVATNEGLSHHSKDTDNVSKPQTTHSFSNLTGVDLSSMTSHSSSHVKDVTSSSDSGDEYFDTFSSLPPSPPPSPAPPPPAPPPPPPPQSLLPVASHSSNQLAVKQSKSMTTDTAGAHAIMSGSEQTPEVDKTIIESAKNSALKDNEKCLDTILSPENLKPLGTAGRSSDPAADNSGFDDSTSEKNAKQSTNQTTKELDQTEERDESFRDHSMDGTNVVENLLNCNTGNNGAKDQQKMVPAQAACASYAVAVCTGQENVS